MKNIEKYSKEILEYAGSVNDRIAVRKSTGEPCSCSDDTLKCEDCIRYVNNCCEDELLHKWAMAEYVGPVNISESDRAFLDYINPNQKYIARDMNGGMVAYKSKPYKCIDCWDDDDFDCAVVLTMFDIEMPMVKWSDDEPWKIDDLKKLEVVEEYEKH